MEIKETCGFLDSDGGFHKTEKEAENANIKIKIRKVQKTLDDFQTNIENRLFKEQYEYYKRVMGHDVVRLDKLIFRIVSDTVLRDSDKFIEIINQKKALEKELGQLSEMKDYENKWWVKYKWW